ncbi:MAG: ABC transporter permease [Sodalis sp. (in: enterobacteria)]
MRGDLGEDVLTHRLGNRIGYSARLLGGITAEQLGRSDYRRAVYQRYRAAGVYRGDLASPLHALVLPSLTVALGWMGYLSRLVRASMLEVLKENHIRTFRAFSMPDRLIALRYALPIAVVPVVSALGVGIGSLLSGAVLTEIVFARPGLSKLAFDSVISRNFPVVMGSVVVTSGLYVLANLLAEVINSCLDPRVRQELS